VDVTCTLLYSKNHKISDHAIANLKLIEY